MPQTRPRSYLHRAIEAHVPQKVLRDFWYALRYGADAPRSDSAIFVDASAVNFTLARTTYPKRFRRHYSGSVLPGDWDLDRIDVEQNMKLVSCRMRWEQGAEWGDTPVFKRLSEEIAAGGRPDDCDTIEALTARYAALDELYRETRQRGRLLTKAELPDGFRREHGGILVHVGRDGTCLRGGGGAHRFAIARILGLKDTPAQLGVVHPDALRGGFLKDLLAPKAQANPDPSPVQ
ncbi:hypothetical protein [Pacificoceanicola onchidii]|uniref:hypothetical protein n=1 Tax=Pacificoceanicola onchidii TaxID=2562685 RepID=UPI001F0E9AFD|nr:hypothetical protein [Pacificoceanicola onchidii]